MAVPQGSGAAKRLWRFGRGRGLPAICVGYPARTEMQPKRSGTNVARWGFHVLSHQQFEFITLLGGVAVSLTIPERLIAQEAGRTYRLGGLYPTLRASPQYVALFDELQQLGFVEGQNLSVDGHGYGLRAEQFPGRERG